MPFYEIYHSYPLNRTQKDQFAQAITALHSRTFKTPSLFVNVRFHNEDASDGDYYVAGTPRLKATNRILAMVRTSDKRKKADFDALGTKIEDAWWDAVSGEKITDEKSKDQGKRNGEVDETEATSSAKKLLFVVFHPMVTARENGVVIPGAGEEGNWLKDNMKYFEAQAEEKGDEDFIGLVKECEEREDLKEMLKGGWVFS